MDDPNECDLVTAFELYGQWWRAGGDEKKRVSGCLSYTPDHGLQLQLYDDLPDDTNPLQNLFAADSEKHIWGEILGRAGREVNVSLFRLIRTNQPNDPHDGSHSSRSHSRRRFH